MQEAKEKLSNELEKAKAESESLAMRILSEKQNSMTQMNEMAEMNSSLQVRHSQFFHFIRSVQAHGCFPGEVEEERDAGRIVAENIGKEACGVWRCIFEP